MVAYIIASIMHDFCEIMLHFAFVLYLLLY